jgi:hypothetical protein
MPWARPSPACVARHPERSRRARVGLSAPTFFACLSYSPPFFKEGCPFRAGWFLQPTSKKGFPLPSLAQTASPFHHSLTSFKHSPSTFKHAPSHFKHTATSFKHTPTTFKHPPTYFNHTPTTSKHTPTTSKHTPSFFEHTLTT